MRHLLGLYLKYSIAFRKAGQREWHYTAKGLQLERNPSETTLVDLSMALLSSDAKYENQEEWLSFVLLKNVMTGPKSRGSEIV